MPRCRLFLAVFFSFAVLLLAQAPTGTLNGRVLDPAKAVIPGATVDAVNVGTNIKHSTQTNGEGLFTIVNLPPGVYRIEVSKRGFNTIVKPNVVLHVQDVITLNFDMSVGSASESITVQGDASIVNTESGSVSTVIDSNFVSQLPLNGRSFNTLMQLTPGVVIAPTSATSPGQFTANGQRTNENYFLVDGVSANFGLGAPTPGLAPTEGGGGGAQAFNAYGGTNSLVSVDALQEFRVETSSFAPEFGHTPGAQVILETRSGTNGFHGGVFDYFRNTILDANDWFNNNTININNNNGGLPRTPEHQNDFGGFLGGPILHDKTFFFLSYEGLRLLQPQTRIRFVPSVSVRNAAIPAAAPFLNAFPLPNGPIDPLRPNLSQFTGSYDNKINSDAGSIRIDQAIGGKWTAFARYNRAPSQVVGRGAFGVLSELDTTTLNTQTVTAGLFGTVMPNLMNSSRFNYSTQDGKIVATLDSFGGAIPPDPAVLVPSPLSIDSSAGAFASTGTGQYDIGPVYGTSESQFNVVDDLTLTHGTHELKFGVDYRVLHLDSAAVPATLTYLVRQQQLAVFAATAQVVNPGLFQYITQRAATLIFPNWGIYAQDIWRVTPRLTLTYGVRWDIDPAPYGGDGTTLGAWENTANPQQLVLAPPGTSLWTTSYTNLAPRVGVAYRITSRGDLVVRGGGGIFYDSGSGLAPALAITYPNEAANRPASPVVVPVANVTQFAPAISFQPPYPGVSFFGFSDNLKVPRSYQWNAALEKSFGGYQSLSVTYVGQIGRDLFRLTEHQNPNANFGPVVGFNITTNGDTSDYHALQVQYRRSLSHGLQTLVNYSWSHCIDSSSTDGLFSLLIPPNSVAPVQADRGQCDFDVRHSANGAVTYTLPRLTSNPILGQVVNGWSVDTVVQARSGFPINVFYTDRSFPSFPFGVPLRPDAKSGHPVWLSCPKCPGGQVLNPDAFDVTTPMNAGRQGNLGRNNVPGFGATEVNLSVMKSFPIRESIGLDLRADTFNVLNHPNFTNPNSELLNGSSFGHATQMLNRGLGGLTPLYQIGGPRSMQLSLKLHF